MRSLLAQEEPGDITRGRHAVQDANTKGWHISCSPGRDVVVHDGHESNTVAQLQAGDLIGEMAAITGSETGTPAWWQ